MRTITAVSVALLLSVLVAATIFLPSTPDEARAGAAEDDAGLTLVAETPEEGFQIAIELARKGVTETQGDREVLHSLRPVYARDADALIAASHVIAIHFQTVAAANDYWR